MSTQVLCFYHSRLDLELELELTNTCDYYYNSTHLHYAGYF